MKVERVKEVLVFIMEIECADVFLKQRINKFNLFNINIIKTGLDIYKNDKI